MFLCISSCRCSNASVCVSGGGPFSAVMLTQQLAIPDARRTKHCFKEQFVISPPSALWTEESTSASLRISSDGLCPPPWSSMSSVSLKTTFEFILQHFRIHDFCVHGSICWRWWLMVVWLKEKPWELVAFSCGFPDNRIQRRLGSTHSLTDSFWPSN